MVHLGTQRRLLEEHKEAKLSLGTQTATPGSEGIKTLAGYTKFRTFALEVTIWHFRTSTN